MEIPLTLPLRHRLSLCYQLKGSHYYEKLWSQSPSGIIYK